MSSNFYQFETANMGTCTVEVCGEYFKSGVYDLAVSCGDLYREFNESDGGAADDIIKWLAENGVEFSSKRSMYFNARYISSVMLDRDTSEAELLDKVASMTDDQIQDRVEYILA